MHTSKKIFFIGVFLLSVFYGQSQVVKNNQVDTTQFRVEGVCDMCKMRIEEAAKGDGVKSATWDEATKILTLHYIPALTNPEKVQQRIANAGHDTPLKTAKDNVYMKLPDCCLYRDPDVVNQHNDENNLDNIVGVVLEVDEKGNFKPLEFASIILNGTSSGVMTNPNGFFKLSLDKETARIAISYAGFQTKTIEVKQGQHLNIVMDGKKELQDVKITSRKRSSYVSSIPPIRTLVMTEKELFKAACCNLSESFETNTSVDVSYSDGVTGSKQIQLLGLSGIYSQLNIENLPGPRGIATLWGLNSIPGTWVESIQLSKGVGSVANGFESITGQINVELKKPETAEQLYANAYVNNMGKTDLNLNLAKKINKNWSTGLLLHNAFLNNHGVDFNKDGFRDLPTGNLFSVLNRWKYSSIKGVEGQAGVRLLIDNKTGGETMFEGGDHIGNNNFYGLGIKTNRFDAFAKVGYVFPGKQYKSIGLQLSTFMHDQDSYFGHQDYDARQTNFYSNLIYQSIIGNTNHKFRTGVSFVSDNYDEQFGISNYDRVEKVTGAFFEYTYSYLKKLDVVIGLRGDHNNLYGFFATPRLHIRYQPADKTTLRIAFGRGQRTANILAENSTVFVSSRQMNILNGMTGKAYGLDPEVAWSTGFTFDQKFRLFNKNGTLGLDFFRTSFENQAIVDLDKSSREVNLYNLDGKSFSNSFLAEINYEPIHKFEVRLAYRLFDVKTTYHGKLLERPLVAKHRGFANLAYEVKSWKFDYTITFNGTKRIPFTGDNPVQYKLNERAPSFVLMNAQVSKTIGKKRPFDFYLGGENLTNFFQQRVIIAPEQPFGQYFDASLIWGPVSGRMFYTGIRYKIK
jgi:outer membrane receptor for ferrienterochelin and colicins